MSSAILFHAIARFFARIIVIYVSSCPLRPQEEKILTICLVITKL